MKTFILSFLLFKYVSSSPSPVPIPTPTSVPVSVPTSVPIPSPTSLPTIVPSSEPTIVPTIAPTICVDRSPFCAAVRSYCNVSFCETCSNAHLCDYTCKYCIYSPSPLPSALPSESPTFVPTLVPSSAPTFLPSSAPTSLPTLVPSFVPTPLPSSVPTSLPSFLPSSSPTPLPSSLPTGLPTLPPTPLPTKPPTLLPSSSPTFLPSSAPTFLPSSVPTLIPSLNCPDGETLIRFDFTSTNDGWASLAYNFETINGTAQGSTLMSGTLTSDQTHTVEYMCIVDAGDCYLFELVGNLNAAVSIGWSISETEPVSPESIVGTIDDTEFRFCISDGAFLTFPTAAPTSTPKPSVIPTPPPTHVPTHMPSPVPTHMPTRQPVSPSAEPTSRPSRIPTPAPTHRPVFPPTPRPSHVPSFAPTVDPSIMPSPLPTIRPSIAPTATPTKVPSPLPTQEPSFHPTALPTQQPTISCPPGYFLSGSICERCPLAHYLNATGPPWPTECIECDVGKVSRSLGSASCETCPAGSFAAETKDRCGDCDPGQYVNGSVCVKCEIGRFAPTAVNGECIECYAGYYTNNVSIEATACIDCGPGEYSNAGSTVCSSCGVGKYSGSRASSCTKCSAGTYSNAIEATSCTNCRSGKYSNEGETACTECARGKKSGARAAACVNCAAGKYTNRTGTLYCTACEEGRASTTSGQLSCDVCVPGRYQSETGSSACNDCPAGQYQTAYEASACIECAVGTYQSNTGTLNCTDCPVGKIMASEGQAICDDCESGRYQAVEGKSFCDLCPKGYWSDEGEIECNTCDVGYWYKDYFNRHSDSHIGGCHKCPDNSNCGGDLCLPVTKVGYWSDRTTSSPDDAATIYRCPTAACTGTTEGYNGSKTGCTDVWRIDKYEEFNGRRRLGLVNVSGDVTCTEGSTGPLCAACKPNWFMAPETRTCKECTSTSYLDTVISLVIVGGVFGILYVFIRNRGFPTPIILIKKFHFPQRLQLPFIDVINRVDTGALKVLYTTIQIIVSVSVNLDMSFPEPFNTFISKAGLIQLDFISADCMEGSTFHTNVYFTSAFPGFLVLLVWLLYLLRKKWNKIFPNIRFNLDEVYAEHFKAFLLISYMFLPPVARSQFRGLNCIQYTHNNDAFLKADSSINCHSPEHQRFIIINAFLILIYQAIPISYIYILYTSRKKLNPKTTSNESKEKLRIRDSDFTLAPYRLLFQDIRCEMWFHEIIDMYRRLLIISVLPLMGANIALRAYCGCFISFLSTIYFREGTPFRIPFTNLLGTIAQYQILIVYLSALMLEGSALELFGLNEVIVGALLFMINFIILGGALFLGWWKNKQELKALEMKLKKIVKIEDGVDYSTETYAVTMEMIVETQFPSSDILVFYYTSFAGAKLMTKLGIPAFNDLFLESDGDEDSRHGIVFSLRGPHCLAKDDKSLKLMNKYAPSYEAVLCVAMPRSLIWSLPSTAELNHNDESLVILPYDALTALRRAPTKQEKKMALRGWEMDAKTLKLKAEEDNKLNDKSHGVVIIPTDPPITVSNLNIKKAYRLKNEEECVSSGIEVEDLYLPTLKKAKQSFVHNLSFDLKHEEDKYKSIKVQHCNEYLAAMYEVRQQCEARGLVPVYHFTSSNVEKFILKEGFRMSTSHGNDGGVFFSTLGPASHGLGTEDYEKNLISNCFGESELDAKLGHNMVDCCIVYGAESRVLRKAPGGIEHSKMFPKNYFETLAEPTLDTNDFFLRPDRILASFIIDPYQFYEDVDDVHEEMVEETENDLRTKQAIDNIQVVAKQNDQRFRAYLNDGPAAAVKAKSLREKEKKDALDKLEEGSTGSGEVAVGDKQSLLKTSTRPKPVPRGSKGTRTKKSPKSSEVEMM